MNSYHKNGAKAYQGTKYTQAHEASPHKLIAMLYDGAVERLNTAKGAMDRNDIPLKGMMISKTINIIEGLRAHINLEQGGDIATNLNDLYQYMENQLLQANLNNNIHILDEISTLLEDLRSAWVGIGDQVDKSAGNSASKK